MRSELSKEKGKGKEGEGKRRKANWKRFFGRKGKKSQTPQPEIEPGTQEIKTRLMLDAPKWLVSKFLGTRSSTLLRAALGKLQRDLI